MAIEIFISYRRNDTAGYALTLFRELQRVFPEGALFYDGKSIDSGANFPQEIESGVRECKVLLAVIAQDWLEASDAGGRRRLEDPNDFVRREIALALELGKTVIPVLFGSAEVPPPDRLPADIRALSERLNVHRMNGRTYEFEAQLDELVRLLARVPGVSQARTRATPALMFNRRRLACLCDRTPQDDEVRDIIREQIRAVRETRRPFVMVVHGPANEAHDAFVERVEAHSVPRLLQDARRHAHVKFLPVFHALPVDGGQSKFNVRLREAMAHHLHVQSFETDEELIGQIRDNRISAAVAVLQWRASELTGDPKRVLDMLFDYWSRFPDVPASTLVGCLVCFKYDVSRAGFFRRILGSRGRASALRDAVLVSANRHEGERAVIWRVLPELPSVTRPDVSRWVSEVGNLIGGGFYVAEKTLETIVGTTARPMDEVLPCLESLLPQE